MHELDKSFLESPVEAFQTTSDDPISEEPGTVIGPYKLLEAIGKGGFGLVANVRDLARTTLTADLGEGTSLAPKGAIQTACLLVHLTCWAEELENLFQGGIAQSFQRV